MYVVLCVPGCLAHTVQAKQHMEVFAEQQEDYFKRDVFIETNQQKLHGGAADGNNSKQHVQEALRDFCPRAYGNVVGDPCAVAGASLIAAALPPLPWHRNPKSDPRLDAFEVKAAMAAFREYYYGRAGRIEEAAAEALSEGEMLKVYNNILQQVLQLSAISGGVLTVQYAGD